MSNNNVSGIQKNSLAKSWYPLSPAPAYSEKRDRRQARNYLTEAPTFFNRFLEDTNNLVLLFLGSPNSLFMKYML